ncbi:MAG TPA: DinB family protein [Terriglobia bacterium]|nr:DinB family protein [Terriglobia bacterium]
MQGSDLIHTVEYDEWATNQLLDAAAKLDPANFRKDLGTSFQSVHGTLVHLYGAQLVWLARWKGSNPGGLITAEQVPTLAELRDRWAGLYLELRDYIRPLTSDQLNAPLPYKDLSGNPWAQLLYQQIQHLMFHSMYHRGQVVTLLRQLGQTPPHTDLILYYRTMG